MTQRSLTCPVCGKQLSVEESAPARLICPNCLSGVTNRAVEQAEPRPVLPVAQQVNLDKHISKIVGMLITVLAAFGAGMWLLQSGVKMESGVVLVLVVGLLMVAIVTLSRMPDFIIKARQARTMSDVEAVAERAQQRHDAAELKVLEYRRYEPGSYRPRNRAIPLGGQIAIGFFSALGAIAVLCGGVGRSNAASATILGILGLLCLLSLFSRDTRGFAAGVVVFFMLGFGAIFVMCGGLK